MQDTDVNPPTKREQHMTSKQIRNQVEELAKAGDDGMFALMCGISATSWKLESAKDSLKTYAESIQRRVGDTLETLDGKNGTMGEIQGLASSYDVAIQRVKDLEERIEGLNRIAAYMIEKKYLNCEIQGTTPEWIREILKRQKQELSHGGQRDEGEGK